MSEQWLCSSAGMTIGRHSSFHLWMKITTVWYLTNTRHRHKCAKTKELPHCIVYVTVYTICPKLHSNEQFLVRTCGNSGCPSRSDDAIEKHVPRSSPFLANDMTIGSSVKSYHINTNTSRMFAHKLIIIIIIMCGCILILFVMFVCLCLFVLFLFISVCYRQGE